MAKKWLGKTATFEVTINVVEEPKLPVLDEEFAKSLGISSGDMEKMRIDVQANLETRSVETYQDES